jgi:plastocyanin
MDNNNDMVNNNGKSNNTVMIIVIILLLVLGGWYFMSKGKNGDRIQNDQKTDELENQMGGDNDADTGSQSTAGATVDVSTPVVSGSVSATATVKEFTVDGFNFGFKPNMMTVNKGDTVKITFKNTGGFHDLVINEFKVATKQIKDGAQETVTFVADKAGTFEYYCSVGTHRQMGMKGTLIVK